jgi:hypothetical protein
MKKMGACIRGERCPYAHNVFEYWLHPTRYRTQLCNDGPVCRRGICFFAHSLDELRVPACKPYVSPEALARASLDAIQANPHPLSAQLPLSQAGTQPAGGNIIRPFGAQGHQLSVAQQQQAAMAALSGGPCPEPGSTPSPYINIPGPDGIPPHMHTHTRPEPPRISFDYGSLPRWSDCPSFIPGAGSHGNNMHGGANRYSHDGGAGAGRYSYDRNSEYASACSTPARLSAEVEKNQAMATMQQHHQQQQRQLYQRQQRDLGSFTKASSGHSSGNSPKSLAPGGGGGGGSDIGNGSPSNCQNTQLQQHYGEQQQGQQQRSVNGVPSPDRRSSGSNPGAGVNNNSSSSSSAIHDDELAHSLATLKIALTQQNAGATTASNHEVVINTLHQILREAVASAQQDGNNENSKSNLDGDFEDGSPSAEDASSAAAAAYAALASSMAAFAHNGTANAAATGSESYPGSRALSFSEMSTDTPNRHSIETIASTSSADGTHVSGTVPSSDGADGTDERSTYRLSQDLVHALY